MRLKLSPSSSQLKAMAASLSLAATLGGCGKATNFNRIWGGDDGGADTVLDEGSGRLRLGQFSPCRRASDAAGDAQSR